MSIVLSEDTLVLLAREGDQEARDTLFWIHGLDSRGRPTRPRHRGATAVFTYGVITAGYLGLRTWVLGAWDGPCPLAPPPPW